MAEIKSEFELIQDSYLKVWQIFMSWFTWFSVCLAMTIRNMRNLSN
ncbi:hypothetical protein V1283_003722 [Bradyrhizobium sp. AZCC 2262]